MARFDGEIRFLYENIAVRRNDGNVNEFDVCAFDRGAAAGEDGCMFCGGSGGGGNKFLFEFAGLDIIHHV